MNLKTKVKSYSFWVSLASALILILKLVGQRFGFTVDEGLISDLFTSLCAILVIMGIIVIPSPNSVEQKTLQSENKVENNLVETNQSDTLEVQSLANTVELVNQDKIENQIVELIDDTNEKKQINEDIENAQPDVAQPDVVQEEIQKQTNEETYFEVSVNGKNEIATSEELPIGQNQIEVAKLFDVQSFIDKVCLKRSELSTNITNFVEFLQSEIETIKNDNK